VPWHRVVNAQGRISFTPSREGSDWIQRQLLLAEGIAVDDEGRLPLGRYLWVPPIELLPPADVPPASPAPPAGPGRG
jgi:methylated-DNA-protein-cysteine methyltransferase-like protein